MSARTSRDWRSRPLHPLRSPDYTQRNATNHPHYAAGVRVSDFGGGLPFPGPALGGGGTLRPSSPISSCSLFFRARARLAWKIFHESRSQPMMPRLLTLILSLASSSATCRTTE